MAPIVLYDPADTATRDTVHALLDKLAADPANGIEAILDHAAVAALGGFPTHPSSSHSDPVTATAAQSPALWSPTHRRRARTATTRHHARDARFVLRHRPRHRTWKRPWRNQHAPNCANLAQLLGVSLPAAKQPALSLH